MGENGSRRRAGRLAARLALAMLGLAVVAGGCQSSQRVDRGAEFGDSLSEATLALNAADLESARAHLAAARDAAETSRQREQVRSLDQFIQGTEALMEGRTEDAAAAWSLIEDLHLYREVRQRARAVGVEMPAATSGRDWSGSLEASRR